jgi:hypothetical protein
VRQQTSGAFLGAEPPPTPKKVVDPGPVGIVVRDLDDAVAYLEAAPVGPYVIIRTVNDVPVRLGGLAILTHDMLTPALRDALTHATLGA